MDSYRHIIEQHVDDAAFLWLLRSVAVDQPHYLASDIVSLESRIDKHLDGIVASLERAWPLCLRAAEFQQGGESFMLAMTAFRSLEVDKIKQAVDLAAVNKNTQAGFISALGWLPGNLCHDWIKRFFTSKDFAHKYLAIAACSVRREDPGEYLDRMLERADCVSYEPLYFRCLRLIGELKRRDLVTQLELARQSDIPEAKFWAVWSSILLGNTQIVLDLEPFVRSPSAYQLDAVDIAFRVLPIDIARNWISQMARDGGNARAIIKATAVLGDPQAVPWLIEMMKDPRLARVAGEAISWIMGIDLEKSELSLDIPNIEELEKDTDPSEISEDENLPWPSVERVSAVWQKYGSGFQAGHRYFQGKLIDEPILKTTVLHGFQRLRHAAAMELAIRKPDQILVNSRASHGF